MLKVVSQVEGLDIYKILKDTGSIMEGHFKLSSGYHSKYYLQCARLLQYPDITYRLARKALYVVSKDIDIKNINAVVSPAMGGILWGYMIAYAAGCRMIFTERKAESVELRRGFEIESGQEIMVAEDVITTGASTKEVIDLVRRNKANVIGIAAIIERSKEPLIKSGVDFKVRKEVLLQIPLITYSEENCPLCKKKIPLTKPGSRK